jgi:endonuclease G, mitochondrial
MSRCLRVVASLLGMLFLYRACPAARLDLAPWGEPTGLDGSGALLLKTAYECLHSPHLKLSCWVAYRAEGEDSTSTRYSGQFFPDPDVKRGSRAELADYKGLYRKDLLGFDRGHQAPDATIRKFGPEAQRETYSLANITPQHSQLNEGLWQDIESAIRSWSSPERPVWVVTGPVFFAEQETTWVGPDRVAVPDAYFAVIARDREPHVLSFLVPNLAEGPWHTSLKPFLASVDSIEKLTGLDFLPDLPDLSQQRLESHRPKALWR